MERPTRFYPTPPKLEQFLMKPTNLKALTESATGTDNAGHSSRTEFAPLNAHQYGDYLVAHRHWLNEINATDSYLHGLALRKRALKGYRESLDIDLSSHEDATRDPVKIPGYDSVVGVRLEKKVAHPPVLSAKPHRAEKRANRKKVRDAQTQAAAHALEAKAAVLAETSTVPIIKDRLLAVKTLGDQRPLHKAELTAAKDAAARVKQIKFGSTDLVANVAPDQGWKIVTRRKGDFRPQLNNITVSHPNPQAGDMRYQASVLMDPATPRNLVPMSAVRLPTSIGAKS